MKSFDSHKSGGILEHADKGDILTVIRKKNLFHMAKTTGKKTLTAKDATEMLELLQSRFEKNKARHAGLDWKAIEKKLTANPEKLWSLQQKDSAMEMAEAMGIELLSEEEYRALQKLGDFDQKTSSWIKTPDNIRKLGGALFCDRRYGQVFTYHNGAESYYAARGFRGVLRV